MPSFLCTVTWCWSTAAGYLCDQRAGEPPGEACDCMGPQVGTIDLEGKEVLQWDNPIPRRYMYTQMATRARGVYVAYMVAQVRRSTLPGSIRRLGGG